MSEIAEIRPPTSTPTEWSEVERPLLLQLSGMGWDVMQGDFGGDSGDRMLCFQTPRPARGAVARPVL